VSAQTANPPLRRVVPEAGQAQLSPMERIIAGVWAEVLELDPAGVGTADDFFELGGNSLAAMRVVLLLDGLVSLKDVMRCSQLHELAQQAGRAKAPPGDGGMLVPLTAPRDDTEATLVCFPYAGGNAVHFRPVAGALRRLQPKIATFAVELPGHDPRSPEEDVLGFAATARKAADEILQSARGSVLLWGHCIGSALALEVARLLAERGRPAEHVFVAAKLLSPAEEIRKTLALAERMTFADIRGWLEQQTEAERFEGLGAAYEDALTRMFRHDSLNANRYLLRARESRGRRAVLRTPCTVVLAKDDPATADYEHAYADWGLLVQAPQLCELETGGHYFTRTQPDAVAALVADVHADVMDSRSAA
jgi:surfactin synthase thioesterase subunit